jgi:ferritin-like protein
MEKKKGKFLKKIYSKLFSDLTLKEYMTYYYYMVTFRRSKLKKMWAEPNEQESIEYLEKTLEMMEND